MIIVSPSQSLISHISAKSSQKLRSHKTPSSSKVSSSTSTTDSSSNSKSSSTSSTTLSKSSSSPVEPQSQTLIYQTLKDQRSEEIKKLLDIKIFNENDIKFQCAWCFLQIQYVSNPEDVPLKCCVCKYLVHAFCYYGECFSRKLVELANEEKAYSF